MGKLNILLPRSAGISNCCHDVYIFRKSTMGVNHQFIKRMAWQPSNVGWNVSSVSGMIML